MKLLQILTAAVVVGTVASYFVYQDEVPNADIVPHPCKPNYLWRGLGHDDPLGGGPRNSFGRDFAESHKWTEKLCRMDSDRDGMTNGQELGDPDCKWTRGGTFKPRTTSITHPGVCDPWNSTQCKQANKEVSCKTEEFICEGINSPDVFNITLRFPRTAVPARSTSYMCFTFELDMLDPNEDYHLIATKPFIDNANVMHHMTISGCDPTGRALPQPKLCNMASTGCQNTLSIWTLGMPGECVFHEAGFKIGPKAGIFRLNMQHHWTNPMLRTDYMDSSGMTLYLTRKLRPNNAAYFSTGETDLLIPPNVERHLVKSTCSSRCTRKIMKGPVNLMTGWNHMHYLGYRGSVEHYRNGEKVRDLTRDEPYSYDNPFVHEYSPPHELRPGDNLETTCVFRSSSRSTTTRMGEGTFDEMCFGFFTYYPAENITLPNCLTWDEIELCDFNSSSRSINNCSFPMLFNQSDPTRIYLFSKILDNCNFYGGCRSECPAAIAEVREHPCFKGKMRGYIALSMSGFFPTDDGNKFLSALYSCDCPNDPTVHPYPSGTSGNGAALLTTLFSVLLCLVL